VAILGGKFTDQDDDDGGSDAVTLPLDDVVCATCGRELAPWMTTCPDDGGEPIARSQSMAAGVPDVPAHLLEGLDDPDGPDDGAAATQGGSHPETGADPRSDDERFDAPGDGG
jgi:hypothetical protein